METKRFTKNDESFVCAHCGKTVERLMEPISAEPDAKRGYIITHRCTKCGAIRRNRAAHTAKVQPDDLDMIIALTARHD